MSENFERLADFSVKFGEGQGVAVSKYRSKQTGITVGFAQIPGPLVRGFLCLATEAFDDDGCPHTLEHLVFLGSEDYPYKGVLDTVANRCFADGTNAWTDTDHTAYTLTTAGAEGFLNLLPVFLDHILYPLLTDEGFYTEVHHVNGKGEDAGVVYSEMQARENTGFSRTWRRMQQTLYPNSSFSSETGGIMANLRSLNAETVRNYHKSYYRPDNLCLIFAGTINEQDAFRVLSGVERKVVSKGALPPFTRPWGSPVPAFSETKLEKIEFPSEHEETGIVALAWRGPNFGDFVEHSAFDILGEYLTDSPVSPLQAAMVDIEKPLCNDISTSIIEHTSPAFVYIFDNVALESISAIGPKMMEIVRKLYEEQKFDLERVRSLLNRAISKLESQMEDSPHNFFCNAFVSDFIYGQNRDQFLGQFQGVQHYRELAGWNQATWLEFMRRWLLDNPYVLCESRPSSALAQQMATEEKERIAEQAKRVNLVELQQKLDAANAKNQVPAPTEILHSVPIPDAKKISLFTVESLRDQWDLPFFLEFESIPSEFVTLTALLDTKELSNKLRPYIELYLETVLETHIQREGQAVTDYKLVVAELNDQALDFGSDCGIGGSSFSCGPFSQYLVLSLQFTKAKYESAVRWLHEILFRTVFHADRLKVAASKLLQDIPQQKREGGTVSATQLRFLNFDRHSNHVVCSFLNQAIFLQQVLERLGSDPAAVVKDMDEFRAVLTKPHNFRFQVTLDAHAKDLDFVAPWRNFLPNPAPRSVAETIGHSRDVVSATARAGPFKRMLIGLPGLESSYLCQSVPGLDSFTSPDLPAMLVMIKALTTMEGPFWNKIRGLGLSYGYDITPNNEEGLLYFTLDKASHLTAAYKAAKEIVTAFSQGAMTFSQGEIEAARSSVVYDLLAKQHTLPSAAFHAFLNFMKRSTPDHTARLLARVQEVGEADMTRVLAHYLVPLFTGQGHIVATVNPSKLDEARNEFAALGLDFEVFSSLKEVAEFDQLDSALLELNLEDSSSSGSGSGSDSSSESGSE